MKRETIRVFYKRPGKNLVEVRIPNELEWIQGAVEGHFEHVQINDDIAMLCNEEGKLKGMAANFPLMGDLIVGPVLFVGVDGEEYTDCPRNRKQMEAFLKLEEIRERARR